MTRELTAEDLQALVQTVFAPRPEDRAIAIVVDLPRSAEEDSAPWRARRAMAASWAERLASIEASTGLPTHFYLYPSVGMNNADLPSHAWRHEGGELPATVDELPTGVGEPMGDVLGSHDIVIAPTEYSATAPLKLLAKARGFRAATMPGFAPSMVRALSLDYGEVNRRVSFLKDLLDRADRATIVFATESEEHTLHLDLRFRTAHASGGLLREPGTAGNLPSGEAYIVPYEGEREGTPSGTAGVIPVQFADEVVLYRVEGNRARSVSGAGPAATRERERLAAEPAYGNLAELGLGVLGDFGVEPTGVILLDEKLGLHIAFGRSDHFGGQVGAAQFSHPEAVVHIDRVYVPEVQPRVRIRALELHMADGSTQFVMRDDRYTLAFPGPNGPEIPGAGWCR